MHPAAPWLTEPGGLAERLRGLREAAGLNQGQLAAGLGWQRTKVVKIEGGRQMPTPDDIAAWAAACGHAEAAAELADMLASVRAQHRQHRHQLRRGLAAVQTDLDRLTHEATFIRDFQVLLIPGLVQTEGYARHVMTEVTRVYGTDPARMDEAVAARMRRQDVLYSSGRRFEFVTTEAALRFRVVPADVMLGQLDRLVTVSGMSNVTLGIIPMGVAVRLVPLHGFMRLDNVTRIETYASEIVVDAEESAVYEQTMDALLGESVTGDEARAIITDAAMSLRNNVE